MKTTKIYLRSGILLTFCWLSLFATCFFSCDVLEPDADVLTPKVNVSGDQVFVYSGNAAFIDLASKVSTNQPVRFKVTAPPKSGSLSDLGKGLLQYTPSGTSRGTDAFEFSIFSQKDEILTVDTVLISIIKDSTDLPCGIYPADDYVYGARPNTPIVIPVLNNDYICGVDSADVEVELVSLGDGFPPYFGEARVVGQSVEYTGGTDFQDTDKVIYRIREKTQPGKAPIYGIVYLAAQPSCDFFPHDDFYLIDRDSLSGIVELPVLKNDSICQSDTLSWHVVQHPRYGSAVISAGGFRYELADSVSIDPSFSDQFVYELCQANRCKISVVDIRVRGNSDDDCEFMARTDSMDLSVNDIQLIYLHATDNDEVCDGYTRFEITQSPKSGTAWISEEFNAIAYQRDAQRNINDTLEYQICNAALCSRAKVFIKREK